MSEQYTWTYQDAEGRPVADPALVTSAFPTQADAELWFGESWQQLAELGVDAVTLHRDGVVVYGPMSLQAAD